MAYRALVADAGVSAGTLISAPGGVAPRRRSCWTTSWRRRNGSGASSSAASSTPPATTWSEHLPTCGVCPRLGLGPILTWRALAERRPARARRLRLQPGGHRAVLTSEMGDPTNVNVLPRGDRHRSSGSPALRARPSRLAGRTGPRQPARRPRAGDDRRAPGRGGARARRLSSTTLRRLRALLGESSVAVAHGSTTLVACGRPAPASRTPLVYRSIGEVHYWANTAAKRVRMRYLLSRPAAVVALWNAAASVLMDDFGVARERLSVIPRGTASGTLPLVDEAHRAIARGRLGLGMTDPVLLSLGSLSPEKNLEAAISCAAALDAWLLIAGDGPLRSRLEGVAAASGNDRVRFLGSVARPEEVIAAADVLLLPSPDRGLAGSGRRGGVLGGAHRRHRCWRCARRRDRRRDGSRRPRR